MESSFSSPNQTLARIQRVLEVSLILNSTLDLDRLLELIIETAEEIIRSEGASILLLDEDTGELSFLAATGQKREELKPIIVPLENTIAGYIVQTGMPLMIPDVSHDPRFGGQVDDATGFITRSILGVPLMVRDQIIGVLEVVNKMDGAQFDEDDAYILTMLGAQAAIALENSRLVSELQRAYTELGELDRLKSDFIAIASHELRTPLAVILGYATFLQGDMTGAARGHLDLVVQSALHLRSLIDDMINLRHIDAGDVSVARERCDFVELVRNVALEFQELSLAKRQSFVLTLPDHPLPAHLDREKIRLALANLISNAIKFTPDGGDIHVEIPLEDPDRLTVVVRDSGIGIPADQLARIFDRFFQVEPAYTRRHEGIGLGLSIARTLVEIHGGTIDVQSEPNAGSVFTIRLPVGAPLS